MKKKSIRRFESFCKSLSVYQNSCGADPGAPFVLGATAQYYNLTFDLAWKVMKDIIVEYHGITDFALGSPREVLQKAFSVGLINHDGWMQMLHIRNVLAHDYDGEVAQEYFGIITTEFYQCFLELKATVEPMYT